MVSNQIQESDTTLTVTTQSYYSRIPLRNPVNVCSAGSMNPSRTPRSTGKVSFNGLRLPPVWLRATAILDPCCSQMSTASCKAYMNAALDLFATIDPARDLSKIIVCQVKRRVIQIRDRKVEDIHNVLIVTEERQVGKEAEIVVKVDWLCDEGCSARTGRRRCLCILIQHVSLARAMRGAHSRYIVSCWICLLGKRHRLSSCLPLCFLIMRGEKQIPRLR